MPGPAMLTVPSLIFRHSELQLALATAATWRSTESATVAQILLVGNRRASRPPGYLLILATSMSRRSTFASGYFPRKTRRQCVHSRSKDQ